MKSHPNSGLLKYKIVFQLHYIARLQTSNYLSWNWYPTIFLGYNQDNSQIARWIISVSSICMIWVFPIHSTSVTKITEPSIIFLRSGVLILNGKENKEATAICFEIRIQKEKELGIITKSPIKNLWKKT